MPEDGETSAGGTSAGEARGGPATRTFEVTASGLVDLGRHESLAASSAALPHGAYTTLRSYGGRRLLRLAAHFDRLVESITLEGGTGALDRGLARSGIRAALDGTGHAESRLRLTFAPPRFFVAVEPFHPLPPTDYESGVVCVTLALRRQNPRAKDTHFIATARAAYERLPEGIAEALLVEDGQILEGLSSNFFAVVEDTLRTEPERIIVGVTRSLVLELAGAVLPVVQRPVSLGELVAASEAFITSVSREVLPVIAIDGRPIGDGRVGPRTRALSAAFARVVKEEAEAV